MKFGIESKENLVLCKNCGYIVSKEGELKTNYCSRCGAPLSIYAINQTEERLLEAQNVYAERLIHLSKELKTNSLSEIMKEISEER